ncbi:MAG: hypothetical protein J1F28_07860 [Oscillospiraceae bacterium]|nr:hypothetical protein [Oscillospiraceae bacterium]
MAKISGKILAVAAALAVQTSVLAGASAEEQKFILREYNGNVALFYDSSDEPAAVYRTPIEHFYPADRELLEKGICLGSREELRRLIEDLGLE